MTYWNRQVKELEAKIQACLTPESSRPVDGALQRAADNPSGKRMTLVADKDPDQAGPSARELFNYLFDSKGKQEASFVAAMVVAFAYWCYEMKLFEVVKAKRISNVGHKALLELEVRNDQSRADVVFIVDKKHGLHFCVEVKNSECTPQPINDTEFETAVGQLIKHVVGCDQQHYQPRGLLVFRDRSFFVVIQKIEETTAESNKGNAQPTAEREEKVEYKVHYFFQHLTVREKISFNRFQCEASALVTGSMENWQGFFDAAQERMASVEMSNSTVEKFEQRKRESEVE